ncbi:thiamine pyrophosphate-dependent dehydrogenase E1 component subunit alpha [Immundisolibacter sp.]|uniref:thiamine pyrophosphate-dependent dehydrogenase E1 component subunit alpha n=1 Tax=Immundisolibacter sp. TaxID=1934948 RepID=UPI003568EC93
MRLIRSTEQRLSELFAAGEVPGFIHLSIGQEAVATGVMAALTAADTIASNHRGHGHCLARGVDLAGLFAEIMGKDSGLCRGRGGSMHVADVQVGMLGANGIVGAGIPLATGSALAHQVRDTGGVAVAFFGDGALAEGVLHESMNLAALWKLPLLLVCENNGWSEFSPAERQFRAKPLELAAAFGIPAEQVNGNDVFAVAEAATRLRVQAVGEGPCLLECITERVRGHYEGDSQRYRADQPGRDLVDPLMECRERLRRLRVSAAQIDATDAEVEQLVEAAVAQARASPPARFADAAADVYTKLPTMST